MTTQTLQEKIKEIKAGKLKAVENVMNFTKKISSPKAKKLNIFLRKDMIRKIKIRSIHF